MSAVANSKRDQFAAKLERLIHNSPLSQVDIAMRLGYANQNIVTMFKKGVTRVPLEKIGMLAVILEVDAASLTREWFEAYNPEALPEIEKHMGMILTRQEKSWIEGLRKKFGAGIPIYDTRFGDAVSREMIANS